MKVKKLYKKETFKTKEEWLNARGLGGSSASAILGKNPYMSILDLYSSIVLSNKKKKANRSNSSMEYGTRNEPLIRRIFADDFSEKFKVIAPRNNEMYRRIDKPYMTATLDGVLINKETKEKGILEIKTHDVRNREDNKLWLKRIPDNYFIQVLHYLLVMNTFTFVVLVAKLRFYDYFHEDGKKLLKTEFRYYYIDRNDENIRKQLEYLESAETKFWEENVKKKVMPKIKIKF